MIEILSADHCIECDLCVKTCPRDVFDAVPDGPPAIARKADCQTCFLCELYCPADALYVSPNAEGEETVDPDALIAAGRLGSFQRAMGWSRGRMGGTAEDPTRHLRRLNAAAG